MGKALTDLSFEDWLRFVFDHPVAVNEPVWWWSPEADSAELEPLQFIDYTTRLFERARESLAPYGDPEINRGLAFLIHEGGPLRTIVNESVSVEPRMRCIQAMPMLFEQCFVPRCTPHLSHFSEAEPGMGPLNAVCYMWWDSFPTWGDPNNLAQEKIDAACLVAMEAILLLPSISCQESALHGLGHWQKAYQDRCENIISGFLQRRSDLRLELREYANRAKEGYVL